MNGHSRKMDEGINPWDCRQSDWDITELWGWCSSAVSKSSSPQEQKAKNAPERHFCPLH